MILGRNAPEPVEGLRGAASVLDSRLAVAGDLESDGEVRIQGRIEGDVTADTVVLEAGGCIEGSVAAREAHIHGRLIGDVFAPTVAIGPTAFVSGTIFHNEISVSPEAVVDGRIPWRPMHYFEGRMLA